MNVTAFVVPLLMVAAVPLSAQTRPQSDPGASVRVPQLFKTTPPPGSPQSDTAKPLVQPPAPPSANTKPRVVCGMTLQDADPNVDRRIQLPKLETNGKFSIRAMQPPICGARDR